MPAVGAMGFWAHLLLGALSRLEGQHQEPDVLKKKGHGIRDKGSWEEIYAQLQSAREAYDGTKTGFWGKVKCGYRKTYRKTADHSEVPAKLVEGLLDQDAVSPVKAIVEVLFDMSIANVPGPSLPPW